MGLAPAVLPSILNFLPERYIVASICSPPSVLSKVHLTVLPRFKRSETEPESVEASPPPLPVVVPVTLLSEEIGRHGLPSLMAQMLQVKDILSFGNDQQKKEVLELVAQGKPAFGLGISEPQAGSDVTSLRATATRDGDNVILIIRLKNCDPFIRVNRSH